MSATNVTLMIEDDGSGVWTLVHPDLGPLFVVSATKRGDDTDVDVWDCVNEEVVYQSTFGVE